MAKKVKKEDTKEKSKNLVSDLMESVVKEKKKPLTRAEKNSEAKNNSWIEDELERVTAENDELRGLLAQEKTNKPEPQIVEKASPTDRNVQSLFNDLEDMYLGTNALHQKITQVTTNEMLSKMIELFPFLKPRRR